MKFTNEEKEAMIQSVVKYIPKYIKDCITELEKDKKISSVQIPCGQMIIDGGEDVQIQIKVTRRANEFLGDLDTILNYYEKTILKAVKVALIDCRAALDIYLSEFESTSIIQFDTQYYAGEEEEINEFSERLKTVGLEVKDVTN